MAKTIELIGTLDDGQEVYDYGSKFFALSETGELLEKVIDFRKADRFSHFELQDSERYEYIEKTRTTHNHVLSLSRILDRENVFVGGHKIDLLEQQVDGRDYLSWASGDSERDDNDPKAVETALEACRFLFGDETIDDFTDIDAVEVEGRYISFAIVGDAIAVDIVDDEVGAESISIMPFNAETFSNEDKELALAALKAEERMEFDACSLLSFGDIDERAVFNGIKEIDSYTLDDLDIKEIAKTLDIDYESLSNSKDKEKYLNLFKQKCISDLLETLRLSLQRYSEMEE